MEKQFIPAEVQSMIDEINNTPLDLGEIEIGVHPLISIPHTRSLRIMKLIANLENKGFPRTDIYYCQILRNDGQEIPTNLPTPEWTILHNETSTMRDQNNERIMTPIQIFKTKLNEDGMTVMDLDEDGQEQFDYKMKDGEMVMEPILLNSHKYLVWLMKNNKAGLVQLLSGYMQEKYAIEPKWKEKLNSI